jgi:WD40 repeat protein
MGVVALAAAVAAAAVILPGGGSQTEVTVGSRRTDPSSTSTTTMLAEPTTTTTASGEAASTTTTTSRPVTSTTRPPRPNSTTSTTLGSTATTTPAPAEPAPTPTPVVSRCPAWPGPQTLPAKGLWLVPVDGAAPRPIVNQDVYIDAVTFSPDGRQLAFSAVAGPSSMWNLFLVNSDGTGLHQVPTVSSVGQVTWSPDGSHIAFFHPNGDGHLGLYTVDADGGHLRHVADSPNGGPSSLAWSPGSDRLAFGIQGPDSEPSTGTFIVDVATGAVARVAPDSTWSVSWSPDGDRLALSTTAVNGTSTRIVGVVLMAADGTSRQVIPTDGFGARFSPDGTDIAVGTQQATKIMAPDGTGLRYLHEGGLIGWSPDSGFVAVDDPAGEAIVRRDGCERHVLTRQKNQSCATWSPDSRALACVAFTGW